MSKLHQTSQQAVHLCAALLLIGCMPAQTPTPKPVEIAAVQAQNVYKFSVQPQSMSPEFSYALEEELAREPLVDGVKTSDAGQIILSATPNMQIDPLSRKRSPSFGRLSAETATFEIRVPYTLSTFDGQAIHSGEIRYLTEPISVVSPAIATRPQVSLDTWRDIASMLLTDALPALKGTPWQAQVIGQIDKDHAVLNFGEDAGLKVRSLLHSRTTPTTVAELVLYQDHQNGTSRAIAKHISGPPLMLGMKLAPMAQNTPQP